MGKFGGATLGVFFATAAYCQVPAPAQSKATPEPSAYCRKDAARVSCLRARIVSRLKQDLGHWK